MCIYLCVFYTYACFVFLSFPSKAIEIIAQKFKGYAIQYQDFMASEQQWRKVLDIIPTPRKLSNIFLNEFRVKFLTLLFSLVDFFFVDHFNLQIARLIFGILCNQINLEYMNEIMYINLLFVDLSPGRTFLWNLK